MSAGGERATSGNKALQPVEGGYARPAATLNSSAPQAAPCPSTAEEFPVTVEYARSSGAIPDPAQLDLAMGLRARSSGGALRNRRLR